MQQSTKVRTEKIPRKKQLDRYKKIKQGREKREKARLRRCVSCDKEITNESSVEISQAGLKKKGSREKGRICLDCFSL